MSDTPRIDEAIENGCLVSEARDVERELAKYVKTNTVIVSAMTPYLRETLTRAVKWLDRIDNRRDELPTSFLDGCDPAPLARDIRKLLREEIS